MKAVVRHRGDAVRFIDRVCNRLGQTWDKPQLLTIKTYKPPRTCEQNALLHVLFREVANHVGRPEDEVKEIFKYKFGPWKTISVGRLAATTPIGTSDYSKEELSNMIEQVYRKGSEWGVEFSD